MQKYTFHNEIKTLLTQFLQAFDGAIVKRYTNDRTVGNNVAVRYVYAPKQRVLHDLVNKAQHITLPAVSFWISNISRDNNRVFNKLEGQYWLNNFNTNYNTGVADHNLQPVPINIEISVSILTKFQTDMDQILSNFVPYNDPYFIISWTRQGMAGLEIRSEVLWSGTLNMTYPVEQTPTNPTRVICDTSFTIKGWLFKADTDAVGRIFKIDTNFYPVSATPTFSNIDEIVNPSLTESFVLSALPVIAYANVWETPIALSGTAEVYGDMFNFTNAVYLSGAAAMFGTPFTYNPFVSSNNLSAAYPAVLGVPATSYYAISPNKMFVNYPAPSAAGYFDVIIYNDAGYAVLSKSTTNFPTASGIKVL